MSEPVDEHERRLTGIRERMLTRWVHREISAKDDEFLVAALDSVTAERDALRARVDELIDSEALIAERDEENARASAAEARLQAVRALHVERPTQGFWFCRECGGRCPCPTVKVLDGLGQEAGQ